MDGSSDILKQSYDRVAAEYTARIFDELAQKPFDRGILDRFAELVRPLGTICDLGCGPGHVARYLHDRGLQVVGLDLSAGMVVQAQRLSPSVAFQQGDMLALPFGDGSLGGTVAFYSIIHVPRDLLSQAFAEMYRTLCPGGTLLLAFHVGNEDRHLEEWWGEQVSIDFLFFQRGEIERVLSDSGFAIEETLERDPYPEVEAQTRRAYILACKSMISLR